MALLAAFVGEFISSNAGLGYHIIVAEGLFNVNQIWVGIIGLVIIALLFNYLTFPLERIAKNRSQFIINT
jgi:NitT/TauT family transport system permease protein